MITLASPYDCCGCEACVQACPRQCIRFSENAEGFCYPIVDTEACIACSLCEKVCPMRRPAEAAAPLQVFAARNRDAAAVSHSSSGGLFTALAQKVLREGGVVFGAAFSPGWREVRHIPVEDEAALPALQGSKYLQSRIGNSFAEARAFLEAGRTVLFCGTGCQILALRRFLSRDYAKLLAVEIVCHGVPSPKVWRKWLDETTPAGDTPAGVSFRDKKSGWEDYSVTISFAAHPPRSRPYTKDGYMWLFLHDCSLRPSCFRCPAKAGRSSSDLTLGDYWGIDTAHPDFYDKNGVSLLLANSEKGRAFLDGLDVALLPSTLALAVRENPCFHTPKSEPAERAVFFRKFGRGTVSVHRLAATFRHQAALAGLLARLTKKMLRKR